MYNLTFIPSDLINMKTHTNYPDRRKASNIDRFLIRRTTVCCACIAITILHVVQLQQVITFAQAINIRPSDFEQLIKPCFTGGGSSSSSSYGSPAQSMQPSQNSLPSSNGINNQPSSNGYTNQFGRSNGNALNGNSNGYQPNYFAADTSRSNLQGRDGLSNLGQQVPRANTIDNFISLVNKIETANPRLANQPDELIRSLLSRFHLDNYYYDVRARTHISEQDLRTTDIISALLNPMAQSQPNFISSDIFPENLLDHNEKCSMYFMLSHFIDKVTTSVPPLANVPVPQLSGPLNGQRPPSAQAAGSGYPSQSANNAYTNGASGPRYPGPSPSFGSPASNNMYSFGTGLSNTPDYSGKNPYGMNVAQPNNQFNQNYNNMRNSGQYSGTLTSNSRYSTPYIDGNAKSKDERQAIEYGVVAVGGQENAAIVLNRVLMGLLAASSPPQMIKQLAPVIYPTQPLTSTMKIEEEIDPLFAVTLADLWAVSSIPKAGKPNDFRTLGDNGRWNDTMCQTSFQLERASSIRFTTAELLGGLDGFNLGLLKRRLMGMRKTIRLSEMLRIYYSKAGFRPQFAEVSVCNRISTISTQMDDLHRQAENYLRLYQLNLATPDAELAAHISRLDSFKDFVRQAASSYAPQDICQDSSFNDFVPTNSQDQCEIAKADIVTVLDTSPTANSAFMNMVVAKIAQRLGLSNQGNSLSVLTNQQDSTGYAGSYSFNAIVRNSTNTAEIGCALVHDSSRTYQGGQITDPARLVEMFERALVNLDSEYLIRQATSLTSSSSYRPTSYVSSLFGQADMFSTTGGPKNTGGAKVIIWFNYGQQQKPASIASGPTNWNGPNYNSDQNQYKFLEAKKYLRENFRGASVLAVSNNRDDVKAFVFDEERDIFSDIPTGGSSDAPGTSDYYPTSDPSANAALTGPADQLVNKLVQRMCTIPAVFQYPMCFRGPSENAISLGYISPGRKQYWMMSPKTFFASKSVRMAFKVEGGRLRVCFGRMSKPDESAAKNQQYQTGSISFGSSNSQNGAQMVTTPSSNDYYTGLDYGICKDVSPGLEVDFIVNDPCYKKSIADCEPFYFVINEISNPGDGDPNYMCRDEGCRRFDQVRFTMTHTGVICSSAFRSAINWVLILISLATATSFTTNTGRLLSKMSKSSAMVVATLTLSTLVIVQQVQAQQAGVHDFGQGRYGEKRGNSTPYEVLAIILLLMTILAGFALTVGLCYYVTKKNSRNMTRVEQDDY